MMIWYLYTLWRDSHYQINTSIISHIYFCFWWECLNSILLCLVTQSCPTLCDPMDYSPRHLCPWGLPHGQEYWSELLCPPLGDHPKPGVKPRFLALQVDSLPSEPPGKHKFYSLSKFQLYNTVLMTIVHRVILEIFKPYSSYNWELIHFYPPLPNPLWQPPFYPLCVYEFNISF